MWKRVTPDIQWHLEANSLDGGYGVYCNDKNPGILDYSCAWPHCCVGFTKHLLQDQTCFWIVTKSWFWLATESCNAAEL